MWSGQRRGRYPSPCPSQEDTLLGCNPCPVILLAGQPRGFMEGVTAAMGRREEALELERVWQRERKATALSLRNGFNILRRGFAKLDLNHTTGFDSAKHLVGLIWRSIIFKSCYIVNFEKFENKCINV